MKMSLDDLNTTEQIIDRCKKGDVQAQYLLYKKYSKAMYNIAIRFLNNKMDAEDILQESFITAFEKLGELSKNNLFGSWVKRIIINNCITHIRKNKIEFEDLENYESLKADPEADFNLEPSLIHNAIKELPAGGRTILILHALEGYKHREIAKMLDVSESTCKTQYKRALDILYKHLKDKIYVS